MMQPPMSKIFYNLPIEVLEFISEFGNATGYEANIQSSTVYGEVAMDFKLIFRKQYCLL